MVKLALLVLPDYPGPMGIRAKEFVVVLVLRVQQVILECLDLLDSWELPVNKGFLEI